MIKKIEKYYLFPSALFADKQPHLVDTILGSCVAVCLHDQKLKIGGINHFMLPLWNGDGLASPKYGNVAIEKLVENMFKMGATKNTLIAKIFGGANQMMASISIGDRNIEVARSQLAEYGIKIVAESVGGNIGRKIRFDTSTGQVLMKFLSKGAEK